MSQRQQHITELFEKYLSGIYSYEELRELLDHFGLEEDNEQLKSLILQQFENPVPENVNETEIDAVTGLMDIHIQEHVGKRTIRRFNAGLWIAAAAIVLLSGIGAAVYFMGYNERKINHVTSIYGDDVLPGGNHATLTLADGSTIKLDSVSVGFLAEQSGMSITKSEDGIITYTMQSEEGMGVAGAAASNTITTPRGGQYKIVLPDGTHVWLNAASSLTYPIRFSGSERKVELNGEGYFEVTHSAAQPFIVQSSRQTIQVFGTSFNVAAYDNDPATTTLVSGSVKVIGNRSDTSKVLKPGQQAEIMGEHIHVKDVDVLDYVSWKDGIIILNQAALPQVIRQIERWYDVEFEISNMPTDTRLNGVLHRNAKLSAILEVLEMNTDIAFRIEGRRIMANR